MNQMRVILFALIPCVLAGCNIGLRENIFLTKPLWESTRLIGYVNEKATVLRKDVPKDPSIKIAQSGFSLLAMEVLGEDIRTTVTPECSPTTNENTSEPPTSSRKNVMPSDLARQPVTKAIMETIVSEYEKLGAISRHNKENGLLVLLPPPKGLPEQFLSRNDFMGFANALIMTQWKPYQDKGFSDLSNKTSNENTPIPWQQLFTSYLIEYYNDGYVDRYGVSYKKPAVGFSITNEVIVALANIFQDSLWDYAQLEFRCTVKAPIVYERWQGTVSEDGKGKPADYLNANKTEPTFAKMVTKKILNPDKKKKLDGVLEPVVSTGKEAGLTRSEVCVVHHISGFSGEASEAITGLIVRSFGGLEAGPFVFFGKLSFGDHETLTKLIDAAVETFSRRSADVVISHILYEIKYNENKDVINSANNLDWEWFKEHIKLAELLECLKNPSSPTVALGH